MEIPAHVLASHAELSRSAVDFIEFVRQNPECLERPRYQDLRLPDWIFTAASVAQPWPTLVGGEKLSEIKRAAVGICSLIKDIPSRLLGNDPKTISEYYGFVDSSDIALFLDPPTGLVSGLARCDFIESDSGIQCLEVNTGAALGGWQVSILEELYRSDPHLSRFFTAKNLVPRHHNPLRTLFAHLIRMTRAKAIARDEVRVLFVVSSDTEIPEGLAKFINDVLTSALSELDLDLDGEIVFHVYGKGNLALRNGEIHHQGKRIHAVLEYTKDDTPRKIFRAFKGGNVILCNSPLMRLLGSKDSIALLSEHEESTLLTEEERALIRAHIPWSRRIRHGETTYRGEKVDMIDFLLAQKDRFVVKPCGGRGGEGVHIGRATSREIWEKVIRGAPGGDPLLAQEFVESRPYFFQSGDRGAAVHEMNWGAFCFGDTWGGAFVRMMPKVEQARVVNVSLGATRSLLFEV